MSDRRRLLSIFFLFFFAMLTLGGSAIGGPNHPNKRSARPAAAVEEGWPKTVRLGETKVVIDELQADSLEGTHLKARGTAKVQRENDSEPSSGTVWYEADVEIDRGNRVVTLVSVEVPKVQLEGFPAPRQERLAARLGQAVTRLRLVLPLDDVLADSKLASRRGESAPKLGHEPPKILFESEPAILITFDGEPKFRRVAGSKLERAVNSPFLVLHELGTEAYYLNGGTWWFRATDVTGPWTKAGDVPKDATEIAALDRKEASDNASDDDEDAPPVDKRVPKILQSNEPAELIVTDGPPRFAPEVEGELEVMSNTESDVFRTVADRKLWVVLSGRWYRSGELAGPWVYVEPDQLPASFGKIGAKSSKANVLAFVPGTAPAREALRDASTPRTSAIKRDEADAGVSYDGEPQFELIPNTHVEYALNTSDQVLKIGGRYYVCDQGVWFSAGAPKGPWAIIDSIPDEEIQAIPPDSPVYNTRFATIYDSTPEVVYVAYTPSYLGSYAYSGAVVFGTGWRYRPWFGAGYYYSRPWTWGFHARYAPFFGWGYGSSWGPGWAGYHRGWGYGRGAHWYGPGGFYRPAFRSVNGGRHLYAGGFVRVHGTPIGTHRALVATHGTHGPAVSTHAVGTSHVTREGHAQRINPHTNNHSDAHPNTHKAKSGANHAKAGAKKKG